MNYPYSGARLSAGASHKVHGEIQGLRALAVVLVVVYHVWPPVFSGGFVGVDVFFIISGFLITGSLVRAAEGPSGISLFEFYNRRIRRLLPAATLVLVVTAVGMFFFLPENRWLETVTQIVASAFYAENWILAWNSVDYLAAQNVPSPVQHYWSLSVEEQFYLAWPFVMIASLAISRLLGLSVRLATGLSLGLIFLVSLAASIALTASHPAYAFFATHTRIWELALGGLLAVAPLPLMPTLARLALWMIGFLAIIAASIFVTSTTPWPGAAALLPTFGALLMLMAGDVSLGRFRGLNYSPLRWIGDRSYSIYLWHWPLIVFYLANAETIGIVDGVGLIAATLVVSDLSFRFVEEQFRHPAKRVEWRPASLAAASLATFSAGFLSFNFWLSTQVTAYSPVNDYPGPHALSGQPTPSGVPLVPTLATLKSDLASIYSLGCHQTRTGERALSCSLGYSSADDAIALVGDSHAASWVPAFEQLALERGVRLITFTKSSCAFGQNSPEPSCSIWQDNVQAALLDEKPKVAFFARFNNGGDGAVEPTVVNLATRWPALQRAGIAVASIKDVPNMKFDSGECLAAKKEPCRIPITEGFRPDPMVEVTKRVPGSLLLDLTDHICGDEFCDSVVGNMIAWRDEHHLTATYSKALAPYVGEQIDFEQIAADLEIASRQIDGVTAAPDVNSKAVQPSGEVSVAQFVGSSLALARSTVQSTQVPVKMDLACEPSGGNPQIRRTYDAFMGEGEFSFRAKAPGEQGYENWRGLVQADGRMLITGEYIEGYGGTKKVNISADRSGDNRFEGAGTRGPRNCTISIYHP